MLLIFKIERREREAVEARKDLFSAGGASKLTKPTINNRRARVRLRRSLRFKAAFLKSRWKVIVLGVRRSERTRLAREGVSNPITI